MRILNVAVQSWFTPHSVSFVCPQAGASIVQSKVAEESDRHQDVSQWSSSGLFRFSHFDLCFIMRCSKVLRSLHDIFFLFSFCLLKTSMCSPPLISLLSRSPPVAVILSNRGYSRQCRLAARQPARTLLSLSTQTVPSPDQGKTYTDQPQH